MGIKRALVLTSVRLVVLIALTYAGIGSGLVLTAFYLGLLSTGFLTLSHLVIDSDFLLFVNPSDSLGTRLQQQVIESSQGP